MPIYVGMPIADGDELPAAVARASIARRTLDEVVFIPDAGRVVPPVARNEDYIRIVPWSLCFVDISEACRFVPAGSRAAAVWDTDMDSEDAEDDADFDFEPPVRPQDSVLVFGHRRHDARPVSDSEIARLPCDWNEVNPVAGTPARIMRFVPPLRPPWLAGDSHPQALAWRCELEKAITTKFVPRRLFDDAIAAGRLHEDFLSVSDVYTPAEGGLNRHKGSQVSGSARESRRPRDGLSSGLRKKVREHANKVGKLGVAVLNAPGPIGPRIIGQALDIAEAKGVPLAVVFTDAFPRPPGVPDSTIRKWFNRTDFFRAVDADGRIICAGVRNIPSVRAFSLALGLEYTTGRRLREGDRDDDATTVRTLRECRVSAVDWTIRDASGRPIGPAGPFKGE